MKRKRKNYKVIYIRLAFLIVFSAILIPTLYYFLMIGLDFKKEHVINYKTNNIIDYKVYLFDNNYFTQPYLPKDKTYISSLIDYIDIDFHYTTNFSDFIFGNYTYYIKGTISAQKKDFQSGDYWSKDYILKDKTKIEFDRQNAISFNENIKLNYQEYNTLLNEFKRTYGISFDGYFTTTLVVLCECHSDNLTKSFVIDSNSELKIPLTQQVIDLSIESNDDNISNTIKESKIDLHPVNYIFILISILLLSLLILSLFVIYKNLKRLYFYRSPYAKGLKKINATYGNIIVNINKFPDLKDLKIIEVSSFEELIDAHSEVRMPINYYEEVKDYVSIFFLISDNIAWIYVFKNEEYQKKKGKLK